MNLIYQKQLQECLAYEYWLLLLLEVGSPRPRITKGATWGLRTNIKPQTYKHLRNVEGGRIIHIIASIRIMGCTLGLNYKGINASGWVVMQRGCYRVLPWDPPQASNLVNKYGYWETWTFSLPCAIFFFLNKWKLFGSSFNWVSWSSFKAACLKVSSRSLKNLILRNSKSKECTLFFEFLKPIFHILS